MSSLDDHTRLYIHLYFAERVLDRAIFEKVWKHVRATPIPTTWFGRGTPRDHRMMGDTQAAFQILNFEHGLSFGDRKGSFGTSRLSGRIDRHHEGFADIDLFARLARWEPQWLNWIFALCDDVPMLFGWACSYSEYNRKHSMVTEYAQGRRLSLVGATRPELLQYLPGVYWLTLLGPQLTSALDIARAELVPGVVVRELASGQRAILAGDSPFDANDARRERERAIAAALGDDYFFDRDRTDRSLRAVPGFVDALARLRTPA